MHPMALVRERIQDELQYPADAGKFTRMKTILSQLRGKSFRNLRRRTIEEYRRGASQFAPSFEANWLRSLKSVIHDAQ